MIIGHQKQWQFLKKSVETGKLAHAYLFCGQQKLGKKTLALELVKLLKCEKDSKEKPCGKCFSCRMVDKGLHPDLIFVEPEPEKKEIVIKQIRNLSWKLSLTPNAGFFKVAVINQAHAMNEEAKTCLLKTLEEPPAESILILVTEYPEGLYSTILSRVQKIKFYPVKRTELEAYLKGKKLAKKETEEIINFSLGKPGLFMDLINDKRKITFIKKTIAEFEKIYNAELAARFQYAENLAKNRPQLKEVLDVWLKYLRNLLIYSFGGSSAKYPLGRIKKIINNIQNTNFLLSTTNVNPRLALDVMMLEF